MSHTYTVKLDWDINRKGTLHSSVLDSKIEVATPPEFPKGMEGIWSPEHLFVASVSSCLMTTFLAIAENSGLEFSDLSISASGQLEKVDDKWMINKIMLHPVLKIPHEDQKARAERILIKSETSCLISNSIKSEIVFKPDVIVTDTVAYG